MKLDAPERDLAGRRALGDDSPPVAPDIPAVHPALRSLWEERQSTEQALRLAMRDALPAAEKNLPARPPAPPRPPRIRSFPRSAQLVAAAAMACLVAGGAAAFLVRGKGPAWPSQWDPRVAPIAAFDEAHRNLKFRHPVPVVFLPDAEFAKKASGTGPVTAADRADAQHTVEQLRALGLASGSPDLISGAQSYVGSNIVGFYDSDAKTVWVRGTDMTPYVRTTLAHELTHVLQDQNFGLKRPDGDAGAAYTSVIEADAMRVEKMYHDSLSAADKAAYTAAENALGQNAQSTTGAVPAAIADDQQFPYQIGPHFLTAVLADRGTAGLDDILRKPPTSTLEIMEPSLYLLGTTPTQVAAPTMATGERVLQPASTSGAFQLLQILSAHLDVGQAWAAARTWSGDSGVAYTANGRTCVRMDVATAGDSQPLEDALRAWVAAGHNGVVSAHGGVVRLDACDPGPKVAAAPDQTISPLDTTDVHAGLAEGMITAGHIPQAQADCVSDMVVQVAGSAGLRHLVDLGNRNDGAAVFKYSQTLGLQARPLVRAKCQVTGA